MSTRYVWGRYNRAYGWGGETSGNSNSISYVSANVSSLSATRLVIEIYSNFNPTVNPETGEITSSYNDIKYYSPLPGSSLKSVPNPGSYIVPYLEDTNTGQKYYYSSRNNPVLCQCTGNTIVWYGSFNSSQAQIGVEKYTASKQIGLYAKGTANGTVSNASSGAYPADGVSGNYWYTLSGSDNIDASAVGYNTQTPMGGQAITINVTPSTGNVYGGTVRYTYQVQLSGGSWQTIASNQTATSRSYTIPAGTTTFAARVLASDTWGFSSSTYTTGATISVTNNLPPTAPGSISVGSIVAGQAVTITLTAATDSDGTIASYIYERSIDGNGWTQIANVNALTYQDTVGQEWATVAYRAKAVDDDGASGPYVTSTTYTVNDGVLYISGPEVEMGTMVKPFTVNMSVGVTGNAATDVAFYVYVDGRCLHDTPVDTGESVPIAIDTRLLSTGDHIITATASKTGYVQASAAYHFETEIAALAGEGYVEQLRDYQGNPIFPRVVAAGIEGINTPTAATVTLTTSGWIQSGTRYAQTVTVEAVTVETAVVIADCALSDDADANASIIEAWGPVMSYPITQGSSTLTFYVDSVPSINIPVNVGVM